MTKYKLRKLIKNLTLASVILSVSYFGHGVAIANEPANEYMWVAMDPKTSSNAPITNVSSNTGNDGLTALVEGQKKQQDIQTQQQQGLSAALDALRQQQKQQETLLTTLTTLQQQQQQASQNKQQESLITTLATLQQQQQEQFQNSLKTTLESVISSLNKKPDISEQQNLMTFITSLQQKQQENLITALDVMDQKKSQRYLNPGASDSRLNAIDEKIASETIHDAIKENTQDAQDANKMEAAVNFFYYDGGLYKVYCREGYLTDIQLQPGEEITAILGGDTSRWMIDKTQSGSTSGMRWHVYIKPLKEGIDSNFVITTNRHSYQIQAKSSNWYVPIISWTYPQETKAAYFRANAEAKRLDDSSLSTGVNSSETLNFKYRIRGNSSWKPTVVYDDGSRTYIKMPEVVNSDALPVLFIKDNKGKLMMVNYRYKNNTFIIDRVFKDAVLKNSQDESVKITNRKPRNDDDVQ